MQKQKGKLIVIDGTDGSGKTTQVELLADALIEKGHNLERIEFPQYNQKSAGLVEEYLSGKYGRADEVDAKITSMFYAMDRYDASFKIRQWLEDGKVVIANRYVGSNMGHQGSKISDPEERKAFLLWLDDLEFGHFKLPRPDINIVLHVESEIAQNLAKTRGREDWVGKKRDIHEEDINHLRAAEQTYLEIAENYPQFKLIKCTKDGNILSKSEIHDLVWSNIEHLINGG